MRMFIHVLLHCFTQNGQTLLHKAAAPLFGSRTAALEFLIRLDVNLAALDKVNDYHLCTFHIML